jgi:hypothetical protein
MIVFLQAPLAALAQENGTACLIPKAPDTAVPVDVLLMYRQELIIEFERYFSDFSMFIACLDAERAAGLEEARTVTDDYARFLAIVTNDENR